MSTRKYKVHIELHVPIEGPEEASALHLELGDKLKSKNINLRSYPTTQTSFQLET